jgi:hypothetical protein
MSRDIRERLSTFVSFHLGRNPGDDLEVHRIALNMAQVRRSTGRQTGPSLNDLRFRA